jgi:hypothetical protein
MWKEGFKFAGKLVADQVVKKMKDDVEPQDERTDEQKRFDRRMKIAKTAVGFIYPPLGRAIFVLETAPVVTKYVIKKVGELRKSDEDDDDEPLQRDSL